MHGVPHPIKADACSSTANGEVFLCSWLRAEWGEAWTHACSLTVCLLITGMIRWFKFTVLTAAQTLTWTDGEKHQIKTTFKTKFTISSLPAATYPKPSRCTINMWTFPFSSCYGHSVSVWYLQTFPGLRRHWIATGCLALKQQRSVSLWPTSHSSPSSTIWFPQMGWSLTGKTFIMN